MPPISNSFFNLPTLEVAKNLLGCHLTHQTKEGITEGKIVEVEAYLSTDPASHSYRGKTKRNEAMFAKAGAIYVYFIYGMHECFNIVTAPEGTGEAILIRALEPIRGIEFMLKRRENNQKIKLKTEKLCNGPAKLYVAMGFNRSHNGISLLDNKQLILTEEKNNSSFSFQIEESTRIGIQKGKDLFYRFYIKGNKYVS